MLKNWLIRTKSNHILGPISKAKACELYKNGSIKPDDELCSGNGYWFFIKESDLIDRYLLGEEVQPYNPISEAQDLAAQSSSVSHSAPKVEHKDDHHADEIKMPTEDDLAFPDMGDMGLTTPAPKKETSHEHHHTPPPITHPEPKVVEAEVHEIPSRAPITNVHIEPPKRRDVVRPKKEGETHAAVAPKTSDHKKLYTLAIAVLLMAIAVLLYRKYAPKSSTPISSFSIIEVAYADPAEIKKKK